MFKYYYALLSPLDSLFKTFLSILYLLIFSKYFPRIKKLKISDEHQSCYILGNGPSLNKDIKGMELLLANKHVIVVNHFSQSDLYEILKPKVYVFADRAFWDFNGCVESVKIKTNLTLEGIRKKTNWKMLLLIPHESYRFFIQYCKDNPNINVQEYNKTAIDGFKFFRNWTYRRNLSMPPAQTVLNSAIFLGINLGYKRIYLLGADHTWHLNLILRNDNVLCFKDDHFYDNGKSVIIPIPVNYVKEKTPKVHDELFAAAQALASHHKIREYATLQKVTIYNMSSTTFIDAYDRKPFCIED